MYFADPYIRAAAGEQQDSTSAIWRPGLEVYAAYVALSDGELERWFLRHKSELVNLTSLDMVPIAAWLPAIGPPANDNAYRRHRGS